jgi:hypothetical protein
MATKLTKPVRRETLSISSRGRKLIASLEPGDLLTFREKGRRGIYEVSLGHAFNLALIIHAEREYKSKLANYNERKKRGENAKKPRKPALPFSRMYFDSLKTTAK